MNFTFTFTHLSKAIHLISMCRPGGNKPIGTVYAMPTELQEHMWNNSKLGLFSSFLPLKRRNKTILKQHRKHREKKSGQETEGSVCQEVVTFSATNISCAHWNHTNSAFTILVFASSFARGRKVTSFHIRASVGFSAKHIWKYDVDMNFDTRASAICSNTACVSEKLCKGKKDGRTFLNRSWEFSVMWCSADLI